MFKDAWIWLTSFHISKQSQDHRSIFERLKKRIKLRHFIQLSKQIVRCKTKNTKKEQVSNELPKSYYGTLDQLFCLSKIDLKAEL